jgi:hypothetical protein
VSREGHVHCFSCSRGLIKKTSVGYIESGELSDHSLVIELHLEASLRDLGLVGGVGCIPLWVLKHVTLDDSGENCLVVTLSDIGLVDDVSSLDYSHISKDDFLGVQADEYSFIVLEGVLRLEADRGGNSLVYKLINARNFEGLQHLFLLSRVISNMSSDLKKI